MQKESGSGKWILESSDMSGHIRLNQYMSLLLVHVTARGSRSRFGRVALIFYLWLPSLAPAPATTPTSQPAGRGGDKWGACFFMSSPRKWPISLLTSSWRTQSHVSHPIASGKTELQSCRKKRGQVLAGASSLPYSRRLPVRVPRKKGTLRELHVQEFFNCGKI